LFERAHHRRIAALLYALDADLLAANACWFGGGTAMAMRYGEYRESVDIDFLVSEIQGYRALRERLTGPGGVQAIARPGALLEAARDVRADQYGVRTLLRSEGIDIKFEIVSEGRIALQVPAAADRVRGIATLTPRCSATPSTGRRRPTARTSPPISTSRSRRCAPARNGWTAAWRRCR